MKQYHDLWSDILENGEERGDRTGVGTLSVFGRQLRFNLREGFPAITTKKLAWKAVVGELLWFLEGSGDERRLSEITHGTREGPVTIWTPNALAQGVKLGYQNNYLGPIYGVNWRYIYNSECFPVKKKKAINTPLVSPTKIMSVQPGTNKHLGKLYKNKFDQEYIVWGVGEKVSNGIGVLKNSYNIQYLATNSIYTNISNVGNNSSHRDGFVPTLYGVGMLGYYMHKRESDIHKRLRLTWENMISRCYNVKDKSYLRNNKNNVIVCDRWLVLSNFIEDAPKLDGWIWFKNFKDVVLDKDYYGNNNIYCPETTVFLPREHNNKYRVDSTPVQVKHNSSIRFFPTKSEYSKNPPLGEVSFYKNADYVIRHQFPVDQLSNLIHGLRTDPFSRRHILTSLDVGSVDKAALPPCHIMSQYYVNKRGELSCHMYQRSQDIFLGACFNYASYALLTHMIAHVCDLKVGELIVNTGDTHIYLNHIEQVKEQLNREPYPQPKLLLNPEIKDIDKFTMDDIKLENYQSHPAIKATMAV